MRAAAVGWLLAIGTAGVAQAAEHEPPPLGIHLVLGLEAPRMFQNVVSLFEEEILAPVEMICRTR